MKDIYTKPQIKLVDLSTEDIVTTSKPGLDIDGGEE